MSKDEDINMVRYLVFILYCLLFLLAFFNLIKQYKYKKIINGFICFQVAFILYYICVPIISFIIISIYPNQLTGFILKISNADSYDILNAFICTFLMYILTYFVYHIRISKQSLTFQLVLEDRYNRGYYYLDEIKAYYLNKKGYFIVLVVGLILLIIGLIADFMISESLGGFLKAISMGDKLRAFGSDNSRYIPENRLFLKVLMSAPLASTYLFAYALRYYKRFIPTFLLSISLLASIFFLIVNSGKLPIILYVVPFFIDFIFRKTKYPFFYIGLFFIVGLAMLDQLDKLFFYLSFGFVKERSGSILSLINEFAFPYLNLLNVSKINEIYGLRLGKDLILWFINIVPTFILRIFGLNKVTPGYVLITEYYNASGGIPTDLITFFIRQFGFIGIIIGGILISRICKYIDKVICTIYSDKIIFYVTRISLMMFVIVPYADLDAFVRNRYDMLFLFGVAIIFSNIVKKIRNNKRVV